MLTVTTLDGRQNSAPLGGSKPEILARLALIELEKVKFQLGQKIRFERETSGDPGRIRTCDLQLRSRRAAP
jgi:hypothetical protein